jgi:hypothetical protein
MASRPKSFNPHAPQEIRILSSDAGGRTIRRRDFLEGLLIGASTLALGGEIAGCGPKDDEKTAEQLPPLTAKGDDNTTAHAVRDGKMFELPPPAGDLLDCVIIGGGVAGLVAAWKLDKVGAKNFLLLEKDAPVGGFARRDGDAAHPFSQAAAYTVYPYNDNLIEVYTDLGIVTGLDMDGAAIVDPKYLLKAPGNNVFIDGKWYEDAWETGLDKLPFSPQVIADLKAFREDMKTWYNFVGMDGKIGFDTPTDASTADADVRALDGMSLLEYVTKKGWAPEVAQFFEYYARSSFGSTHDTLSAWAAINFLGSEFYPTIVQPGGNSHLALALAAKIGAARLKTNTFVVQAKNEGNEVHVSYLEGGVVKTVRAKTAIFAAYLFVGKYILPDLLADAARYKAVDAFQYTPYIVANVHVTRTPAGLGYDNWCHGDYFMTDIIVADWASFDEPAKAPLSRPNVLTCYCPLIGPNRRAELLDRPYEAYEKLLLDSLEKVLPGVRDTVTAVDLYRWGHAMLAPNKGFVFGKEREDSQKPLGLISFARHDVDALPAFENSVGAAYRAVEEVRAVLKL